MIVEGMILGRTASTSIRSTDSDDAGNNGSKVDLESLTDGEYG